MSDGTFTILAKADNDKVLLHNDDYTTKEFVVWVLQSVFHKSETDAAVIMKVGRNLAKVRRAVEQAGLMSRAIYVERGTMEDERIMPLADCKDVRGAYFGMVLIPGEGRRI